MDSQKLRKLIDKEFVVLTYRNKYNLPLNDNNYMNLSEIEMDFDLRVLKEYKEYVQEVLEQPDIDDDWEEVKNLEEIKNKGDNSKIKLDAGYSEQEIEDFWNKDL